MNSTNSTGTVTTSIERMHDFLHVILQLIDNTFSLILPVTSLFNHTLLIIYAVPLLLLSIVFNFAGAFLTLDRTRSFPPRSDAVEPVPGQYIYDTKKKSFIWLFEGGCGGLVIITKKIVPVILVVLETQKPSA